MRRETGKEWRVEVPHSEGLANYIDPESCVMFREEHDEALTGEKAGWVLSHEITFRMPTLFRPRKATCRTALSRAVLRSGEVGDPTMSRRSLYGNREISRLAVRTGPHREGKSRSR